MTTVTERSDREYWERRYAEWWDRPFHGMTQESEETMALEERHIECDLRILLRPDYKVLDAGCGYGRSAPIICPLVSLYDGVDFAKNAIDEARENAPDNAMFFFCDLLEFHGGPYDVIVAVGLERTPELMAHIESLLKPGGVIYP